MSRNIINPVLQHIRELEMVNDVFSLIHGLDHTINMFDNFINHQDITVHIVDLNRQSNSGPKIEILDDSEEEKNNKKILQIEDNPQLNRKGDNKKVLQIEDNRQLNKKDSKWVIKESSKSKMGILNDFELDNILSGVVKTSIKK